MTAALEQLAEVVRGETGITIQGSALTALDAAVSRLRPAMDAAGFLAAHNDGGDDRELLARLINEVTIRETFFFRQRDELDAIDWRGLHAAARAAGSDDIRVWVAACASGEEAYTLAMLASDAFGTADPPVSILATDISTEALEWGHRGRYRGRAVRGIPEPLRMRHCVASGDGLEVSQALRRLVEFRRHNLVHDPPPTQGAQRFELIACRNVLIYFDNVTVERVIDCLEQALAPEGTLVLGAADRLCDSASRLARPEAPAAPRRGSRLAPKPILRRPLGRDHEAGAAPAPAPDLNTALRAANEGNLELAVEITGRMLADNALDADAYFVRGMAEVGLGDTDAAVTSLRRALYVDPTFGLAAFTLAGAHEQRGDADAAERAYEQALGTLESDAARHEAIVDQVDVADVAAACTLRLAALRGGLS